MEREKKKRTSYIHATSWFVSIGVLASFPSFMCFCCCCSFFFFLFRSFAISSANLEFASELSAISPHYTLTRMDCFVCEFCSKLTACVSHTIELMSAMRVKSLLFYAVRCLPLFCCCCYVRVLSFVPCFHMTTFYEPLRWWEWTKWCVCTMTERIVELS